MGLSHMSRYDEDCQAISMIQFHSDWPRKVKNNEIAKIEKRMGIEEQKELDGKGTGYYND